MSHIWIKDETDEWAVFQLLSDELCLNELLQSSGAQAGPGNTVAIVRTQQDETDQWHLLATSAARVRINGLPLLAGLRTLRDRDQISIGEGSAYFSIEERAHCVAFPGADRKLFCARCRQELLQGVTAVRCPQCNVWHHQTDELPCWTYAAHCGLCAQPTDLEAGYRWRPED